MFEKIRRTFEGDGALRKRVEGEMKPVLDADAAIEDPASSPDAVAKAKEVLDSTPELSGSGYADARIKERR